MIGLLALLVMVCGTVQAQDWKSVLKGPLPMWPTRRRVVN